METQKRIAVLSNGHVGESMSISRRSSRLKAPGGDLPMESGRRGTRHPSLASVLLTVDLIAHSLLAICR